MNYKKLLSLRAFLLNEDGSITKCSEQNVSSTWASDNTYLVPTDPSNLILDDLDNSKEKAVFSIGADGIPAEH